MSDVFSRFPGNLGQNKPVNLHVSSFLWYNIDPPRADVNYPYQGNLRFRHGKNNVCNAGFADGSVREFHIKMRSDKSPREHDALRRYFMIKWPPGVPADRSIPG
jgi:prepilin-type processing-associated H-X9-DG protein